VLWTDLLKRGVKIHFAHRTFQWSSEARGKAAVHCVIIGFALHDAADKRIFDYETLQAEPQEISAKNINPYLVDAGDIIVFRRSEPICSTAAMRYGSKPADGGYLILTLEEKDKLLSIEPNAAPFIRTYIGSEELINNKQRYCLWLIDCPPDVLRRLPTIISRIERVQ